MNRNSEYKIRLFSSLFQGLRNVYGAYDPKTEQHYQVRRQVEWGTFRRHLKGIEPYGFYPLVGDRTWVAVADFDTKIPDPAVQFVARAQHYSIAAYLERSKSKGYHAWVFFPKQGVTAWKARRVRRLILEDIEMPTTEVFPKQDSIDIRRSCGNFINAPLFGRLVPEGRTVFVKADDPLEPYPDQWAVLESVQRITEELLDEIIAENKLDKNPEPENNSDTNLANGEIPKTGLPWCARKMLEEGVTFDQRVACFRLAVNLRRTGIPFDLAVTMLLEWRGKNQPEAEKGIITEAEIKDQVRWAYKKKYAGLGCNEEVVRSLCHPECPVRKKADKAVKHG